MSITGNELANTIERFRVQRRDFGTDCLGDLLTEALGTSEHAPRSAQRAFRRIQSSAQRRIQNLPAHHKPRRGGTGDTQVISFRRNPDRQRNEEARLD